MNDPFDLLDRLFDRLDVLNSHKNPGIACMVGVLFGSIGLGIYLKSFEDFVICTVVLMLLVIFIPGVGVVPGFLLTGVYGYFRVKNSNERL